MVLLDPALIKESIARADDLLRKEQHQVTVEHLNTVVNVADGLHNPLVELEPKQRRRVTWSNKLADYSPKATGISKAANAGTSRCKDPLDLHAQGCLATGTGREEEATAEADHDVSTAIEISKAGDAVTEDQRTAASEMVRSHTSSGGNVERKDENEKESGSGSEESTGCSVGGQDGEGGRGAKRSASTQLKPGTENKKAGEKQRKREDQAATKSQAWARGMEARRTAASPPASELEARLKAEAKAKEEEEAKARDQEQAKMRVGEEQRKRKHQAATKIQTSAKGMKDRRTGASETARSHAESGEHVEREVENEKESERGEGKAADADTASREAVHVIPCLASSTGREGEAAGRAEHEVAQIVGVESSEQHEYPNPSWQRPLQDPLEPSPSDWDVAIELVRTPVRCLLALNLVCSAA
jgi:colicin import membrane protein